jgi:hypothetical protein
MTPPWRRLLTGLWLDLRLRLAERAEARARARWRAALVRLRGVLARLEALR